MTRADKARAALTAAADQYRTTKGEHEQSQKVARAAALTALKAGVGPAEVARLSPFTDAYVRRLAREAGIPPAREPRGVTRSQP